VQFTVVTAVLYLWLGRPIPPFDFRKSCSLVTVQPSASQCSQAHGSKTMGGKQPRFKVSLLRAKLLWQCDCRTASHNCRFYCR